MPTSNYFIIFIFLHRFVLLLFNLFYFNCFHQSEISNKPSFWEYFLNIKIFKTFIVLHKKIVSYLY